MTGRRGLRRLLGTVAVLAALGCSVPPRSARSLPDRSPGGAARDWSAPVTLGERAVEVRVAMDPAGRALATWLESPAPMTGVVHVAAEDVRGSWSSHVLSRDLAGRSAGPRIAAGPGVAAVVWRQIDNAGTRIHAAVRDGGSGWIREELSFPPDAYEPEVVVGSDGEVLAVWNQAIPSGLGVSVARRDAVTRRFARPLRSDDVLSPPIHFSNAPDVAVNERGSALVSWYQSTGSALNAFASERSGPDAAFTRPSPGDRLSVDDPRPEGASGRFLEGTVPAVDASGRAAVVWTQPVDSAVVAVFLATRDPQGRWSTPRSLRDSFSGASGQAWYPRLATGDGGDLWVVWKHVERGRSTIRLAHRDAAGRWVVPGRAPRILSAAGAEPGPPAAAGASAGVLVAWAERSGAVGRVVAHSGSTGVLAEGRDRRFHSVSAAVGGPGDRAIVGWVEAGSARISTRDGKKGPESRD